MGIRHLRHLREIVVAEMAGGLAQTKETAEHLGINSGSIHVAWQATWLERGYHSRPRNTLAGV